MTMMPVAKASINPIVKDKKIITSAWRVPTHAQLPTGFVEAQFGTTPLEKNVGNKFQKNILNMYTCLAGPSTLVYINYLRSLS